MQESAPARWLSGLRRPGRAESDGPGRGSTFLLSLRAWLV